MATAAKIFAANIAGIYYDVHSDSFLYKDKPVLAIKCALKHNDQIKSDETNVIAGDHYFRPKYDPKSIEQCKKIGKALIDKKYSGPLDRYINGLTGVPIKTPTETHGEAKAKKPKYYYLTNWKMGIPRKEFAEEDIPALMDALEILFGKIQIVIENPDKLAKEYFENELKWCGTCRKRIEQYEIAHGLARKHGKGKSNTDPENLYRTCFDCNRTMIDEHILHYQHKLDSERKEKYLSNDPKSRLGNRALKDMYEIHKKLRDLGIETEDLDKYSDPLDVYKKLVVKEAMAVLLKQYVPDDWILISKKDAKGFKNNANTSKCCVM